MDALNYYEIEAQEVDIFGNLREVAFSDAIVPSISSQTKTLIDVGCGDGYILHRVINSKRHRIPFANGLDLAINRLNKTKGFVPLAVLTEGSILSLPFKDNSFDTVICSETLEHIEDYQHALQEIIRIAKKWIIITVPNKEHVSMTRCPECNYHFYNNDHKNSFEASALKETIIKQSTNIRIQQVTKFHTIFSYNNTTLKWPAFLRILFDRVLAFCSKKISFFKPNYLLILVKKNN